MIRATLLAMMLATPAAAQTAPEAIDKLADQYDDFAPAVEEKPLDELVPEPAASSGQGETLTPPGDTAADVRADATPASERAQQPPEGWVLHETFGLTFAVPPDWKLMRESDDTYGLVTPDFAPGEKKGLAMGVQLLEADDFRRQFLKDETFARLLAADDRPALLVASGIGFDRITALPEQTGEEIAIEAVISRYRHAEDGHLLLNFIAFDPARLAADADLVERILATLRLADPERFVAEATLVDTQGQDVTATQEAVSTLGGLVTIRPPEGWELEPGDEKATLRTETVFSAYVTLRRDRAARAELDMGGRFQAPPRETAGEILGQPATVLSGLSSYAGMQVGTQVQRGNLRIFLLRHCLPDGSLVTIETAAAPGWLKDNDLNAVLDAITTHWPEGMKPCHPAVMARANFVMGGLFAYVLPDGFQTGRSRSSFWIRTKTDPYAAVSVGTGPDAFPADFQLAASSSQGNGFIAAPEMRQGNIMGESASLFVGRSQAGEGSRVQHVALLDRCLPDGTPVVVKLRADDAWLSANGGFEALLNHVWIFLPEGAQPCDPALLQTAVDVSGAAAAQIIEPAEDSAHSVRGVAVGPDVTLPEPSDGGTDNRTGTVCPVLDGDMSGWSVSAAEFEASASEITAKPGGDGGTSYYVAPALAMGDWSHAQVLRLDKKSHGGSYYVDGYESEGDIVLEGPAGRAVYLLPKHHSGEWRHFEIPLNDPGWRLSQGADTLADVLSSVTALRIRAEYGAGTDHSGLRNVNLVCSHKVAPAQTAEQLRAAGLQSMLDGDYEMALDQLERSLALKHDEALAGRVARLRLFLKVRPDPDPTNEARGE
jgi:hypothetical protein